MMGSRGTGVDQLAMLSDLIICSSTDRLQQELDSLHAAQESAAQATAEFEAARTEHDRREAELEERVAALAEKNDELQLLAAKLADEQAALV
jgi:hypothetical protein